MDDYDSDKKYAVYGYGAICPGKDEADHCFPLSFDQSNPTAEGVEGVLDLYGKCTPELKFYGYAPVCFLQLAERRVCLNVWHVAHGIQSWMLWSECLHLWSTCLYWRALCRPTNFAEVSFSPPLFGVLAQLSADLPACVPPARLARSVSAKKTCSHTGAANGAT